MEGSLLEVRGLGIAFGKKIILDGVNLALPQSGVDVLMGPVKTGKSTLMNTLAGRYRGHPLHRVWGEVLFDGQPIDDSTRPSLVAQQSRIVDQRLIDVILQPLRESGAYSFSPADWRAKAVQTLESGGLGNYVAQLDKSLLECPQQVRRAVHMLAQLQLAPRLLFVDEPTYGLDEREAGWLIDWVKTHAASARLWITLHNQMQARRLADRVLLLAGGRVIAHQDTQAFFGAPANEWVTQFVRTGSLSLPSPGARIEDLDESTPPPPELSATAKAIISEGEESERALSPEAAATPVTAPPVVTLAPVIVEAAPAPAPVLAPAPLPPVPEPVPEPAAPTVAPGEPENTTPPVLQLSGAVFGGASQPRPVAIPEPSSEGITLAATVGEVQVKDKSAPRGFHWVVPGRLAGCPAPGVVNPIDYDLKVIKRMGVTRLITLTEKDLDQEALARNGLSNLHLPIFDREAPSVAQTHMLLVRMERMLTQGEVLAVHCKAGLGRTGTILASWMIRDGGFSALEAIRRLRLIEPGFIQSVEQEEFLVAYENDLVMRLA